MGLLSATVGLGLLVLEVEDEANKWGLPCSERSSGTWLSEREREEHAGVGWTFYMPWLTC